MIFDDIKDTAKAEPCASSMIITLRAIGYNLETAVADVVDNSISANAKNIWFNSVWKGESSVITILDDGCGMTSEELVQAMKPGAKNPLDERSEKDLGRFGLGLKTASFFSMQGVDCCE
jgi:DNA mismatch repair enzyme (predicted ATPase)